MPSLLDHAAVPRHHATYLVSNLTPGPGRAAPADSPGAGPRRHAALFVGLTGPVDRARLLRMAAKAGAAESARFVAGHTEWFLRTGVRSGHSPDRLLDRVETTLGAPESAVAGLHVFTFNQVRQAGQWRTALLVRLGIACRA
jgi:methylenetetrahydrofolate reductase (NADPH)